MQYKRFTQVLAVLATSEVGYSVGDIQRIMNISRGEGETVLRALVEMGWANADAIKYRSNINKIVYTLNREAVDFMIDVIVDYSRANHQVTMPLLFGSEAKQE